MIANSDLLEFILFAFTVFLADFVVIWVPPQHYTVDVDNLVDRGIPRGDCGWQLNRAVLRPLDFLESLMLGSSVRLSKI